MTKAHQEGGKSLVSMLLLTFLVTFAFVLSFIAITVAGIGIFAYQKVATFAQAAQTTPEELLKVVRTGFKTPLESTDTKITVLVLGVDAVANRQGDPLLTDTMLLSTIDATTGAISLLSLPRDLWLPEYQTKINALYFYGQERSPEQPERFPTEVISELINHPIEHTVVVNLDQVATFIDLLGGVEVVVETPFIDTQFPRSDVALTTTDPALLYETIEFKEGLQIMSGETALKFIRSRYSQGDEGTDTARGIRQQQVIEAVINKLQQKDVLTDPQLLGKLFGFYNSEFALQYPPQQVIALGNSLFQNRQQLEISLEKNSLSIDSGETPGVLFHPPLWQTQNQWSYLIKEPQQFQDEVWQKLEY